MQNFGRRKSTTELKVFCFIGFLLVFQVILYFFYNKHIERGQKNVDIAKSPKVCWPLTLKEIEPEVIYILGSRFTVARFLEHL